ncbi:T5orf172 domain-containing protein [Colletotrichum cereale]|nr:T5orf172 domain-containing protein [Colletotrichum cereale]
MAVLIQPKWPQTLADLQACLSAPLGSCTSCQGRPKKKPTCGNRISVDSRKRISLVVLDILASGSLSSAARHLERLASLVLCRSQHQKQAAEKTAEWERRIRDFIGLNGDGEQDSRNGGAEPEERGSKTAACSRRVILVVEQETVKEEGDERKPRLDNIPFKPLACNSTIYQSPLDKPTVHTFTPYGRPAPASKINKDIVEKLLAPFSDRERNTVDTGCIYGYRLPKGHTTASGADTDSMIKIGYTKDLGVRMRRWKSTCGYTPNLVLVRPVRHYVKMEKVVHLHLANERRWDLACPGCRKKCGKTTNHKEFFEVDVEKAQAVVGMWAAWADLGPFDEEGRLTAYWAARLEALDLDDEACWDKFVLGKDKMKAGSKLADDGGVA